MAEMGGDTEKPIANVDDALEILLHNATEEFGFSPRDVYDGVFRLAKTKETHDEAVKRLNYERLQSYVSDFSDDQRLSQLSHRIIAVTPREIEFHHVKWAIDFKSERIAKMVAISMRSAEENHIRTMCNLLYTTPATSHVTGWLFESFAHRVLPAGWRSAEPLPEPIFLVSDGLDPPTFTVPDSQRFVPPSTHRQYAPGPGKLWKSASPLTSPP